MSVEALGVAVRQALSAAAAAWLDGALDSIGKDPSAIRSAFPAAGRRCGRGPLGVDGREGTVDDGVRVLLLAALEADALAAELPALYRYGDAAEKRGVLRALSYLPVDDKALDLVRDALRTNDTRLVSAALGEYGSTRLDAAAYRQGVLKCVFMGIPLAGVSGLSGAGSRLDADLVRMLASFAEERAAAGRDIPADVVRLVPALSESPGQEA